MKAEGRLQHPRLQVLYLQADDKRNQEAKWAGQADKGEKQEAEGKRRAEKHSRPTTFTELIQLFLPVIESRYIISLDN
ncbi:hypothetical protein N7466_003551 [Penicillium verhagenii]|uniref:uncharacterized protein n=1 Tax=Penicillium verhagenii TaxID=1562060 RepID=UPI002545242A|nr:uncharacterized protein N7466_003551 [Penicillium verhagenii]KAJ5937101.1 hypothetical protein N7466_003551 [Penicillium verhagenii]